MFLLLLSHHQEDLYKGMYICKYTIAFRASYKHRVVFETLNRYALPLTIDTTKFISIADISHVARHAYVLLSNVIIYIHTFPYIHHPDDGLVEAETCGDTLM
jgi:hypothetical protein